jgi:hypothetical protein
MKELSHSHSPYTVTSRRNSITLIALVSLSVIPCNGAILQGVTWDPQSTQQLTKANAGTILIAPGTTSTISYTTQTGSFASSPQAGTVVTGRDWSVINPANHFGAASPKTSLRIGSGLPGNNLQTFTFSAPLTDPYVFLTYARGGAVYDFSSFTILSVLDSGGVTRTGNTFTGTIDTESPQSGFLIQLGGTFSSLSFNINNANQTGTGSASEITFAVNQIPEPSSALLGVLGLLTVLRRRR